MAARRLFLDGLEAASDPLPAATDQTALANFLAMVVAGVATLACDGMTAADLLVLAAWPEGLGASVEPGD